MNTQTKVLASVIAAIVLLTGCVETEKQKQQRQQQAQQTQAQHQQELQAEKARHQRELLMAQQAAAATATSQTLQSQQALTEQARKDGFTAGDATGRLAAMSDIERREEKARQHGHQTGLIEGKGRGCGEGLAEGEKSAIPSRRRPIGVIAEVGSGVAPANNISKFNYGRAA